MDSRFTLNLKGKCGLTYRKNVGDDVVAIDIIDDKVVSPDYRCSSSSLVIDLPHT